MILPARRHPAVLWCCLMLAALLFTNLVTVSDAVAGATPPGGGGATNAEPAALHPAADATTVAPAQRDRSLTPGWRDSSDLAWTTAGDADAFHLLVAPANTGYTWRTVASLSEPGIETDRWIGQACLTGSGRRAVVVYAPRQFSNRDQLFGRGGFAAIVDLESGRVTKLGLSVSLAYYNPGCGVDETAVLTQSAVTDHGRTRLHLLDTVRGVVTRHHELAGQVTSAVPEGDHIVAAERSRLIGIAANGKRRTLATVAGSPFRLHPLRAGGVAFLEMRDGKTSTVEYLADGRLHEVGSGQLTSVGLSAGIGGRVFVTGTPQRLSALPNGLRALRAPAGTEVSTLGELAVTSVASPDATALPGQVKARADVDAGGLDDLRITARVPATARTLEFRTPAGAGLSPRALAKGTAAGPIGPASVKPHGSPTRTTSTGKADVRASVAGSSTDPVEDERTCSVPRNDPRTQVEQPHWRQVEWAADLAVQGALKVQRPANWRGSGINQSWTPQGMYPSLDLVGGGRVPASVMLGILAQESNLWQASRYSLEGVTGSPLIGNYYGNSDTNLWAINWSNADCGYGVGQVTDGMRKAGRTKPNERARPEQEQRAIAMDYATNIAASLRILQEKWNLMANIVPVNNGDAANIENWFAAVWAYNAGVNPQPSTGNTSGCTPGPKCTDGRGNWGLGWGNNPANPDYPYDRKPFLNGVDGEGSQADAIHPNLWPYPEKVMGWAAYPIVKTDFRNDSYEDGYRQAWWTTAEHRTRGLKPPLTTFCAPDKNNCQVNSQGRGSCGYSDYHCWWHWPAAWKSTCTEVDAWGNSVPICGQDKAKFAPGSAEPPSGTHFPPVCSTDGLPTGSLIVDDLPDSVPPIRAGCDHPTTNQGSFALNFQAKADGTYPSKVDFHQRGSGLDGHLWFTSTVTEAEANLNKRKVTGTWSLDRWWANIWAQVYVHVPGNAATTQGATYVVDTGWGDDGSNPSQPQRYRKRVVNQKTRYVDQDHRGDRWVSLGAFNFAGTPKVSLSNVTLDGDGSQRVVFDAVAFKQLSAKPRNSVVAMGDSYSSGEGASENHDTDYYRETDSDGKNSVLGDACHRSRHAWVRRTALADRIDQSIGSRADSLDPTLDFQFLACSGATTTDILPGRSGSGDGSWEVPQIEAGYLDENTTLVTLSIGGNDAGFGPLMQRCLQNEPTRDCQNEVPTGATEPISILLPRRLENRVKPGVDQVLDAIHAKAPNAKIVLMGYPRLFDNARCLAGPLTPPSARVYMSPAEATWANSMSDRLDDTLRDAATGHSAYTHMSDPREQFRGRGVCASDEAIQGLVLGQTPGEPPLPGMDPQWSERLDWILPSRQSFHPKIAGTALYASTFTQTLRDWGL